jgi:hypothetical protein
MFDEGGCFVGRGGEVEAGDVARASSTTLAEKLHARPFSLSISITLILR